jgi:hypothetical protein
VPAGSFVAVYPFEKMWVRSSVVMQRLEIKTEGKEVYVNMCEGTDRSDRGKNKYKK